MNPVARTSEVLAEQLRSPGFRTVDGGYDSEAVRDHLVLAHGLITRLERDVEEFQARALAAEAAADTAEAHAPPAPSAEDDELLRVVFEGQARADALLAAAEAEAARLAAAADERVAALRDDTELARLRALAAERAAAAARVQEAVAAAEDDLRAVAEATDACRRVVGDRLAAALADLRAEPALAGTITSTERT